MLKVYLWLRNLFVDEEGQTLAEYGLILVLIAVVVVTAVTLLGGNINNVFNSIAGSIGGEG